MSEAPLTATRLSDLPVPPHLSVGCRLCDRSGPSFFTQQILYLACREHPIGSFMLSRLIGARIAARVLLPVDPSA